jgi:hypothetical protein
MVAKAPTETNATTATKINITTVNKPGKVYFVPEYTGFPHAFFATRILKY